MPVEFTGIERCYSVTELQRLWRSYPHHIVCCCHPDYQAPEVLVICNAKVAVCTDKCRTTCFCAHRRF